MIPIKASLPVSPETPSGVPLPAPSKAATIADRLMAALPGVPRIFFSEDVRLPGVPQRQVRYTLAQLAREGAVVRLAWGVYCRPPLEDRSMRRILPSPDEVARAVAERSRILIVPSWERAARRVGLEGGPERNAYDWLTSGAPRKISLSGGRAIRFIMCKEARVFAFRDDRMRDLSNGIRHVGLFHIGDLELDAIRVWLKEIPEETYREDLGLCPEWVREIMELCRNNGGRPGEGDLQGEQKQ